MIYERRLFAESRAVVRHVLYFTGIYWSASQFPALPGRAALCRKQVRRNDVTENLPPPRTSHPWFELTSYVMVIPVW